MTSPHYGPQEALRPPTIEPIGSTPETMQPIEMAAQLAAEPQSELAMRLATRDARENNGRFWRGVGMALGAAGVTYAVVAGSHTDGKITHDMPFSQTAQEVVESIDTGMAVAGATLLAPSIALIGGVKIGSKFVPRLRAMDKISSKELSDDGKQTVGRIRQRSRQTLRNYVAGTLPLVSTVSVALGGTMAAVSTEIGKGTSRPIQAMFDAMPGNGPKSVISQDETINPMLQSNISRPLVSSVMRAALEHGISATPVDLFLPSITHNGENFTSLVLAFPQKPDSELAYTGTSIDCQNVPVKVDKSSSIKKGEHIVINGTPAVVVGELSNTSAINRIGVEMDRQAVATCLYKNPEAPDTMVMVGADKATTLEILQEANANLHETASTMSEADYEKSSNKFWEANSKPITNVLALMAMALSYVSMDSITHARMLRNRREWATKLAQGVGDTQMRMTELLRAMKDGVAASVAGVGLATVIAPTINFLESGLRVGIDFRSAMVGCAVGIIGSVGGTLHRVWKPRKTINVSEDTRI